MSFQFGVWSCVRNANSEQVLRVQDVAPFWKICPKAGGILQPTLIESITTGDPDGLDATPDLSTVIYLRKYCNTVSAAPDIVHYTPAACGLVDSSDTVAIGWLVGLLLVGVAAIELVRKAGVL